MVRMPDLNTPQFPWVKSRLPNKAQPVPPIPGDAGAYGFFDDRAKRFSTQLWANKNRNTLFAGAKVAGGATLMFKLLSKRKGNGA